MASRILLLSSAIAACSAASVLAPRDDAPSPGMLSLPIEHRQFVRPMVVKRQEDTNVPLLNYTTLNYMVALSIGSNGQKVQVTIDTGSDELWVSPDCQDSSLSSLQERLCVSNGKYNPSTSTTADALGTSSRIPYGKGSVRFNYYADTIALPDSTINLKNVTFGVATSSEDIYAGIMGLSYGNGVNLKYNNFVDELVRQNVTKTKAFTIALGSSDVNKGGVLIFGGADTKKWTGPLARLPILPPQGRERIARYWVQMDAVGMTLGGNAKTYSGGNLPVVVDSGSSLTYLPSSIVSGIAADLKGQYDRNYGFYFVDCKLKASRDTVDFTFSGFRLAVSLNEFIWDLGDGKNCVIGAQAVTSDTGITALLGDSFMRSAYTIFDQTSGAVYMGQYQNCGQNEVAIDSASGPGNLTGECKAEKKSAAARVGASAAALAASLGVAVVGLL